MNTEERTLPHSLEAEKAVLGAILIDNARLVDACAVIAAGRFFRDAHRRIFGCMVALADRHETIDLLTLREALGKNGELDEVGGPSYISALVDGVPMSTNIEAYARIVEEKAALRDLIYAGNKMIATAYAEDGAASAILETAEQAILGLASGSRSVGFESMADIAPRAFAALEQAHAAKHGISGVSTGFTDLDAITRGLQPGTLVVLGARPGMGKAQPFDAKILTPSGWQRMADMEVGDLIVAPDGTTPRVNGVFPQGEKEIFRITFSDGRSTECCADHLWRVYSSRWRGGPRVIPTSEIADKLTRKRHHARMSIDLCDANFGTVAKLPIDPWLLGFLLGDGSFLGSRVGFSTADPELLPRIEAAAPGMRVTHQAGPDYRLVSAGGHRVKGQSGVKPNDIKEALVKLGLWNVRSEGKSIPAMYMDADRASRMALLQGLLDSDGWAERIVGTVRFSTTSEALAEDVCNLAWSIGAVCTMKPKAPGRYTYKGEKRVGLASYVCNITYRSPRELFTLARKRAIVKLTNRNALGLTISSVTRSRVAPAQCIAIDHPLGLYVTDDYIVTHNTSLAMNIASHAAIAGYTVGVDSLEMPNEELFIRQIAARARLDSHSLQGGYLSERDWTLVAEAVNAISGSTMFVDETPGITAFEVRSRARRLKAEHGLDLLVIDYLQLMGTTSNRHDNRSIEIGAITSALKGLAKELKIPILLLSQLSRDQEKRGNRPKLSDLRDSGSIEQDADIVLFLYRAEDAADGVTELIIAKHRNGQIGTVKLSWFERQTRFDNYSEFPEPEDQRLPMGDR